MTYLLYILIALLLAFICYREFWARRLLKQSHFAEFDGRLYRNGATYFAVRPGSAQQQATQEAQPTQATQTPQKTVLCFPGFTEDMRYFQSLYQDIEAQLILVNNADYHCAFPTDGLEELDWPANPYAVGTIEYDGYQVGQIIKRFAATGDLVVHGHSRGGAVLLEVARQHPDLVGPDQRHVEAVLEAPVLPQAYAARLPGDGAFLIGSYLMPIFFGMARAAKKEQFVQLPMMQPTTPLKTDLCMALVHHPRHYSTCVTNVRSIRKWQRDTTFAAYERYAKITVVIGERDDILDNPSMRASAEAGVQRNAGVTIRDTADTNHFITLEVPHYLRNAAGV